MLTTNRCPKPLPVLLKDTEVSVWPGVGTGPQAPADGRREEHWSHKQTTGWSKRL